mgnify:CR=1 FL=1
MIMRDLILTILGGAFLFFMCKKAGDKRAEVTHRCPKCGTICNANRNATGLHRAGRGEVHSFKCPNCGNSFYD